MKAIVAVRAGHQRRPACRCAQGQLLISDAGAIERSTTDAAFDIGMPFFLSSRTAFKSCTAAWLGKNLDLRRSEQTFPATAASEWYNAHSCCLQRARNCWLPALSATPAAPRRRRPLSCFPRTSCRWSAAPQCHTASLVDPGLVADIVVCQVLRPEPECLRRVKRVRMSGASPVLSLHLQVFFDSE